MLQEAICITVTHIYTLQKIPNRNKHYQQKTRWHRWIDNFDYLINSSNVTGFQLSFQLSKTQSSHFVNNGRGCDARYIVLLRENKTGEANQCADRVLCLPTDDSFDSVYFCFIKPNQKNLVCSGLFSYVRNPLNCSLIKKSRE